MSRDNVAALLSLMRSAYMNGYMKGLDSVGEKLESDIAFAEASAIAYVEAREQNLEHPLAQLCAELARSAP